MASGPRRTCGRAGVDACRLLDGLADVGGHGLAQGDPPGSGSGARGRPGRTGTAAWAAVRPGGSGVVELSSSGGSLQAHRSGRRAEGARRRSEVLEPRARSRPLRGRSVVRLAARPARAAWQTGCTSARRGVLAARPASSAGGAEADPAGLGQGLAPTRGRRASASRGSTMFRVGVGQVGSQLGEGTPVRSASSAEKIGGGSSSGMPSDSGSGSPPAHSSGQTSYAGSGRSYGRSSTHRRHRAAEQVAAERAVGRPAGEGAGAGRRAPGPGDRAEVGGRRPRTAPASGSAATMSSARPAGTLGVTCRSTGDSTRVWVPADVVHERAGRRRRDHGPTRA